MNVEVVIFFAICMQLATTINLMRWMMISRGSKYYYASSYYVNRLLDYAFIVVLLEQFGAGRWELTVIMVTDHDHENIMSTLVPSRNT